MHPIKTTVNSHRLIESCPHSGCFSQPVAEVHVQSLCSLALIKIVKRSAWAKTDKNRKLQSIIPPDLKQSIVYHDHTHIQLLFAVNVKDQKMQIRK